MAAPLQKFVEVVSTHPDMTDAQIPDSQRFGQEETPTVIAGRRHIRTLTLPRRDAAPAPTENGVPELLVARAE